MRMQTATRSCAQGRPVHGSWALFCLLALTLAGCSSERPSGSITRIPDAAPAVLPPAPAREVSTPVLHGANPAPSITPAPATGLGGGLQEAPSASRPGPAADPGTVSRPVLPLWSPLTTWCRAHEIQTPARVSGSTNLTVAIRNAGGLLQLTLGSHVARWNGAQFWLGFAPRVVQGDLVLHRLDFEKHLHPLLLRPPELSRVSRVVVIDPGHGGENTGARSAATRKMEKDYALDWALRLKPLLVRNGWQVHLTRTNDVHRTLPERVGITQSATPDLFLSLHFNTAVDHPQQSGLETYRVTPQGMPSHLIRDFEDHPELAWPNNAHDTLNFLYALRIHRELLHATASNDRGVRCARFMGVLRPQTQPAVLVEGGYLSNPQEAARIAQPEYRQKLAEAVAQALQ